MSEFIIPLADDAARDADKVGPKVANLAALAGAGLPTPGGFCLSAEDRTTVRPPRACCACQASSSGARISGAIGCS